MDGAPGEMSVATGGMLLGSAAASAASPALHQPRDAISYFYSAVPSSPSYVHYSGSSVLLPPMPSQNPPLEASQQNHTLLESLVTLPTSRDPMHCSGPTIRFLLCCPTSPPALQRCRSFHLSNLRTLPAAASSLQYPSFCPFPLRAILLFPQALPLYPCERLLFSSSIQPALQALFRPLRLRTLMQLARPQWSLSKAEFQRLRSSWLRSGRAAPASGRSKMKTKFGAAPFESLCFQDPAQHCRRAESPTRFPWFHVHRTYATGHRVV